jgi:hypothetical protein
VSVVPLPAHARWVSDLCGEGRALRVSAHAEAGFLVLSIWRGGECAATARLLPAEAAELLAGLAEGLGHLAEAGGAEPA